MTGRNQDAIKRTAAGLLKLLHPHATPETLTREELEPVVELAVEMRKRVTNQLAVMLPSEFRAVVSWYLQNVYGRHEGPGILPFYCDPERIGHLAVKPEDLETGDERALFRLFVALAMYQARRDVVIMRQQLGLSRREAESLGSMVVLGRRIRASPCRKLRDAGIFDRGCSVSKAAGVVDCSEWPGAACHVKDATRLFNRLGDLGKLPTSAWFQIWHGGGLRSLLHEVFLEERDPRRRAELLVGRFSGVHRVGRKLATMFVSALSVPSLAPGLTPWFPDVDGNDLVVVDTNVARAVDTLSPPGSPRTYGFRERWIREAAGRIDLRSFRAELPGFSPRLVQQSLYSFCSRSNRVSRQDECLLREFPCSGCAPVLCPLLAPRSGARESASREGRVRPPSSPPR